MSDHQQQLFDTTLHEAHKRRWQALVVRYQQRKLPVKETSEDSFATGGDSGRPYGYHSSVPEVRGSLGGLPPWDE